jgi:L-lactate dehydrogenase complex protein LldF
MSDKRDSASILFPSLPFDMHARTKAAVRDIPLRQAIASATAHKDAQRKAVALEVFGDKHAAVKDLAGGIRQHTLDHLDVYLERFTDAAEAAGAQVHFAADAAEANAIALDIARRANCKLAVKAKSMATEEMRLLAALLDAGIETWETDLAEFILQLDGDAPSHIVTAMIHKDRAAVGRAFERELGIDYTDDPETLTRIARDFLRDKYRRADLGITGANFLVADTGSLVLCTNEGNGRFCATATRIHIALVGIEKLVPTHEHLAVMLKLLARTSSAQPLTCYTQIITGPRRAGECDGPEQLHIILLDNGRADILADPTFREALRCIRCGACLNTCPVYRHVGGHSYGSVYSGPIGAVLTPLLRGMAAYHDLPQASSLCGACGEACPVKIDLPGLLIALRRRGVERRDAKWTERMLMRLYAWSLRHRWRYRLGQRLGRFMLRGGADEQGFVRRAAAGPLGAWTRVRDLPAPSKQSFMQWWESRSDEPQRHRGTEEESR